MEKERIAKRGFTIIELLIVVVVIAILASIAFVAYNGVQNRANDMVVQNDLNNFAKKLYLAAAENGGYPVAGATRTTIDNTGNSTIINGFTFQPSKGSYMTALSNLYYCTGTETATGQPMFRVLGRSRSNNLFAYSSNGGAQSLGNTAITLNILCQGMDFPQTWAYGYYVDTGAWWPWTNG